MFAKRAVKANSNKRKRIVDEDEELQRSGVVDGSIDNADDEAVITPIVDERRKLNTFSTGSSKRTKNVLTDAQQFESNREIVPQKYAGDATYETQIDTAHDRDARAIMERNLAINADGVVEESGKLYKGQAAYKNYITKNEAQIGMNKYTGTQGPIRAQTWARSICRFDYQPDICKDYKETGFCGYGDSCKFLHDRGDYKSGWQLEQEYEAKEKKRLKQLEQGMRGGDEDDDDDKYVIHSDEEEDEAGEQFACTICRKPFVNAVETLCGHIFCEACALKQFKKSSRCFNCRKQTNGVFHAAEVLRRRERERKEREQAEASEQDDENSNK